MATSVSRDPFARTTLVRRLVETSQSCSWCGQKRRGSGKLFEYGTERDGIYTRPAWHKGLFCGKSCHNDYHG
jgi:hypothetical protein